PRPQIRHRAPRKRPILVHRPPAPDGTDSSSVNRPDRRPEPRTFHNARPRPPLTNSKRRAPGLSYQFPEKRKRDAQKGPDARRRLRPDGGVCPIRRREGRSRKRSRWAVFGAPPLVFAPAARQTPNNPQSEKPHADHQQDAIIRHLKHPHQHNTKS